MATTIAHIAHEGKRHHSRKSEMQHADDCTAPRCEPNVGETCDAPKA